MDAKKALDILVQVTGQVSTNRETHILIQKALDTLKQEIEKKK